MKKTLLITLFSLAINASVCNAQRNAIPDVAAQVEQALARYDFETAEQLLEVRIAALNKKKLDTSAEENQLEKIQEMMRRIEATERVTFIDSVVVPRTNLIQSLLMGKEAGSILSCAQYFNSQEADDNTLFQSQLKNHIIFAQQDNDGSVKLYESNLIGKEWSQAVPLKGLNEGDKKQNYPFMLTDGATLYYAAENDEEGFGGYDIYMTRYDADEHAFLAPENIGMPFNSEANDYLYLIDEFNNLGWFVTDRNQTDGNVCIYTFIPNSTRRIYNAEEMGSKLGSLANLESIRDTWFNKEEVQQAQARLLALRVGSEKMEKKHDFDFVINDRITYTTLSDVQTEDAKQKIQWWVESKQDLQNTNKELQGLRDKYALSSANEKQQLAAQITILEKKLEDLHQSIKEQEKAIRKAELGN